MLARVDQLLDVCTRAMTAELVVWLDTELQSLTTSAGLAALPTEEVLDVVLASKEAGLTRAPSPEQRSAWTNVLSRLRNAIRAKLGERGRDEW